ncbi:pyridoxamine 5'-phosphate oxidase family protein [Vibrio sp. DNB22_10_4]
MNIEPKLIDTINNFLSDHSTLSLASCQDNLPWSSDLFYVHDHKLNLYFISNSNTQHALNIARNPNVSVSISKQYEEWQKIKGIQIIGKVDVISGTERILAIKNYSKKFSFVSSIRNKQVDLLKLISNSQLYRISPIYLKYMDNTTKFGYKREFTNNQHFDN